MSATTRRTIAHSLLCGLCVAALSALMSDLGSQSPAFAASSADNANKERLQRLLKKRFQKPKSPRKSQELFEIGPKGKVRRLKKKRSDLRDEGLVRAGAAAGAFSVKRAIAPDIDSEEFLLRTGGSQKTVINRHIVVIQLKPTASDSDIDSLIRKYRLNVIRAVPGLGAIYVQIDADAPTSSSGVRSLLEPEIVVRLRQEPVVNAAFVQSTISQPGLPPVSGASVQRSSGAVRWHWLTGKQDDGNWGLKAMRMPAVWTLLSQASQLGEFELPIIALLDQGFGRNKQVDFAATHGQFHKLHPPIDCAHSHAMHVAGIIGARHATGFGIDGMLPNAELHAIPASRDLLLESTSTVADRGQIHLAYFADVIRDLAEYFDHFPLAEKERRIVNVSLAYNWSWVRELSATDPTANQIIRNQIQQHANFIQYLVNRYADRVLFVSAAGNDSDGMTEPLSAMWASPFAFAALHETPFFQPSGNIIVVEAHDRDMRRAAFSNTDGHVSAPGVDVMSTLASASEPFGVCSGTSQAAPHVAALAAILFALDSSSTPEQVIATLREAAHAEVGSEAAPRVDALSAIAHQSSANLKYIADLNGDGGVDADDIAMFKADMIELEAGRFGGDVRRDLNGDGRVDKTERCWPRIDLNGSGRASHMPEDRRRIDGRMMSDLDVLQAAWSDGRQTFDAALKASGLTKLIAVWQSTALIASTPLGGARAPCLD